MGLFGRERYGTDAFTDDTGDFGLSTSSAKNYADSVYVAGDGYIDDSVDATATKLDSDSHLDADHSYAASVSDNDYREMNGNSVPTPKSSSNSYVKRKSNGKGGHKGCLIAIIVVIIIFTFFTSIIGAIFGMVSSAVDSIDNGIRIERYDDGYDYDDSYYYDDTSDDELSPDDPLINSEYDDGDKYGYSVENDYWSDYVGIITRDEINALNNKDIEYGADGLSGVDDASFLSEQHFVLRHGIIYFEAKLTNVTDDYNRYGAFGTVKFLDEWGNQICSAYFESDGVVKSGDSYVISVPVTADSGDDTDVLDAEYAVFDCYF